MARIEIFKLIMGFFGPKLFFLFSARMRICCLMLFSEGTILSCVMISAFLLILIQRD
jgi:hypothetical protein